MTAASCARLRSQLAAIENAMYVTTILGTLRIALPRRFYSCSLFVVCCSSTSFVLSDLPVPFGLALPSMLPGLCSPKAVLFFAVFLLYALSVPPLSVLSGRFFFVLHTHPRYSGVCSPRAVLFLLFVSDIFCTILKKMQEQDQGHVRTCNIF